MQRGNAKGLLFAHLREFAVGEIGETGWKAVLESLAPGDAAVMKQLLLGGSWYPVGTWNRLLTSFLEGRYDDPHAAMHRFSRFLGERELTGLVSLVLEAREPEAVLRRTGFLWRRYFDQGVFVAEEAGPRRFHLWLVAPTDEDLGANRYTCAHGPGPWLTRGLELAGVRNGRVEHVRCRFDGHPRCDYVATW